MNIVCSLMQAKKSLRLLVSNSKQKLQFCILNLRKVIKKFLDDAFSCAWGLKFEIL